MNLFEHVEQETRDYDLERAKASADARKNHLLVLLMRKHSGKENAIKAHQLAAIYKDGTDRPTRLAIQALRNEGHLVLSNSTGPFKGYFMATTQEEYDEFRHHNFRVRALSILTTDSAMAKQARRQFGDTIQLDLFTEEA